MKSECIEVKEDKIIFFEWDIDKLQSIIPEKSNVQGSSG